jgi:predicted nucleic-acid-binding protein
LDYVTDTHSLVWFFTADDKLSSAALQAFQSSEKEGTIIVPAVVLAEIMFIAKKAGSHFRSRKHLDKLKEAKDLKFLR